MIGGNLTIECHSVKGKQTNDVHIVKEGFGDCVRYVPFSKQCEIPHRVCDQSVTVSCQSASGDREPYVKVTKTNLTAKDNGTIYGCHGVLAQPIYLQIIIGK